MKPFLTLISSLLFVIISVRTTAQVPDLYFQKSYGGSLFETGKAIVSLNDGEFVFCADTQSDKSGDKGANSYGGIDFWVVKTNEQGDLIWETSIGGDQSDTPSDICKTADGGFLIIGTSKSVTSGNKSAVNYVQDDVWLVKLSSNGSIVWDKPFGGTSYDFGQKVISFT